MYYNAEVNRIKAKFMTIMTNRIGGLSASDAAFNYMNAANSLTNLCSFSANPNSLLAAEKQLQFDMFNDSLSYKARLAQDESLKKLTDENIKRQFSTFA